MIAWPELEYAIEDDWRAIRPRFRESSKFQLRIKLHITFKFFLMDIFHTTFIFFF
jgi:hypothetical protein